MTVYRVLAGVYRGRRPGETFEAQLDIAAELRAVNRGQIEVVKRTKAKVRKGSYRLPKDQQTTGGGRRRKRGADAHTNPDSS